MSLGSGLFTTCVPKLAHLITGKTGLGGEIDDLRKDLLGQLEPLSAMVLETWTDIAVADVDAIKTSIASSASIETYTGTQLNGAVGQTTMSPPRNITITTTANADIDAVAVVITGRDIDNNALTENITLTNGGGVTNSGVKAFACVTSIVIPAQSGVGGALTFGFGNIIGFAKKIKVVAGLTELSREVVNGLDISRIVQLQLTNVLTADLDAIKLTFATSAVAGGRTFSGILLDGVVGVGTMSPPRNITVTSTLNADVDAVAVVITGQDVLGNVITDTLTLTNGGGDTTVGTVCFAKVTSIFVPAESGAGGAHTVGFGDLFGFPVPIKFANADPQVLSENEAGTPKAVDVLAGTYAAYGSSLPFGSVDPGANANDTNDYFYAYLAERGVIALPAVGLPYGTYTPVPVSSGKSTIAVAYEADLS